MANLNPTQSWDDVPAWNTSTLADGLQMNAPAQALLNRTEVLRHVSGIFDSSGKTQQDINDIQASKNLEIESRADDGDGSYKPLLKFQAGGGVSDVLVVHPTINRVKLNLSCAAITGGGSLNDENLIGYGHNRLTFNTPGSNFNYPFLPTDLTKLRLFKMSAFNVMTSLSSPENYTATINGSSIDIVLVVALTANEKLIVEDPLAIVEASGTDASYSWIGGGYDNVILNGVMQHVTGAHHRVLGGDHGTILGGSYGIINGGSYGVLLGGTNLEIGSGGGVGSIAAGGYRNQALGATSTVIGGQENKVLGSQAAVVGGTRNNVSGTASFASGRNNTVSGGDAIAFGNGNTVSGVYGSAIGYQNTVSHQHSHARGGYKAATSWQGQDIRFAYRDTAIPLSAFRQHFYIDLSEYTSGTTASLLKTLDGVTSITPPASTVWKCKLQVVGRGGNLKGATFDASFTVQRDATTTTMVGTVDITSKVDAGMGTTTNAASISVAIVSNAIQITVQPRLDTPVGTKWGAVLEVLEVA